MFGRVRASSISSLEMERPPPKVIKHDSLSIYESTLLKLKQGSHCNPRWNPEDSTSKDSSRLTAMDSPDEDMTTDANCSSTATQSTGFSQDRANKNMSILHFFSRCKSSQHTKNSNNEEVMVVESGYSSSSSSSSSSVSQISSSSQLTGAEEIWDKEGKFMLPVQVLDV